MARYGHAFGMVCRGYDPYLTEWPEHLVPTDLHALLAVIRRVHDNGFAEVQSRQQLSEEGAHAPCDRIPVRIRELGSL